MFCKNCGTRLHTNAAVCVRCGCASGQGYAYCHNCGHRLYAGAAVCTHCGVPANVYANSKSKIAAGLMGIFLGSLGIHNFYLGYTNKAIIQLLICLLGSLMVIGPMVASIWGLIDGIMILTGKIATDAKGVPLKD